MLHQPRYFDGKSDCDEHTGFAHQHSHEFSGGALRLGGAFLRRSNVIERSRPIMRELMLETGETSNLGIHEDGNVLFVSQVETHDSIRAFFSARNIVPAARLRYRQGASERV